MPKRRRQRRGKEVVRTIVCIDKELLLAVLQEQIKGDEVEIKQAVKNGLYGEVLRLQGRRQGLVDLQAQICHNDLLSSIPEKKRKKHIAPFSVGTVSTPGRYSREVASPPSDPLPPPGFNRWLSPMFCEHANETPQGCSCPPNCSCRQRMCRER